LYLQSLTVKNFRNLENATIPFKKRISIFVGKNAQGKTSTIEALYLLAHTKSFRESRLKEVISLSASNQQSEIIAQIVNEDGIDKSVACLVNERSREFYINGNRVKKATDFYATLKVVEFTPEDLQLVKGEPQQRRDFLDKTISLIDKQYLEHLISYQKAIKNRNAILKAAEGSNEALWEESLAWSQLAADHAVYLLDKRREFVLTLSEKAAAFYKLIAVDSQREDSISLGYRDTFACENSVNILVKYRDSLNKDRALKRTNLGPHRDDLIIHHQENHGTREARSSASQGQARSISLALKISALVLIKELTSETPILLLDDVESELDTTRINALYRLISESLHCQTFITAVDGSAAKNWFKNEAEIFQIDAGKITAI
jgi:DNA replication and repair protein RecF